MKIRPYLRLLQTPAAAATPSAAPVQFDRSRPAPHTDILRATWFDGHERGIRTGYHQGWRYGLLCGACTAVAVAGLMLGVASGLGWW